MCYWVYGLISMWSVARRGNERKPRRVAALSGVTIAQVAIGGWHCLALDAGGAPTALCLPVWQCSNISY